MTTEQHNSQAISFAEFTRNLNGYEPITTFWQDFSIADHFGIDAVKDTYRRAFEEWRDNYQYLTELVLVLNLKGWQHYDKNNELFSQEYFSMWEEAHNWALDNLKGDEFQYYFEWTD